MTNTITVQDGSGATTTPALILGYDTSSQSRNRVFDTLDGGILVAVYPTRPRAGTLRLFYLEETAAATARDLHTREATFTLASTERPSINMAYAVFGAVRLELDPETRDRWTVEVGYQEIVV